MILYSLHMTGIHRLDLILPQSLAITKIQTSQEMHNITYVALGAGLLWFGWFGFNGGSTLAANGQAAIAFVNTDVCASLAMVTWLFISWVHDGKPSMTGAMAGAVAPAAGFVQPWASAVMGVVTAFVCYGAIQLRRQWGWDDALDVWACHGMGGTLGTILTGVFAAAAVGSASGLIEGNWHQLGVAGYLLPLCASGRGTGP